MQNLNLAPNRRALIIVAHPDDETIWMGGTILQNLKTNWTIFSLCRCYDIDRYPKFLKVMRKYRAKAIITNLEDEGIMTLKQSVSLIKKLILKNLTAKKFDYLFIHNLNGEYGHERHIGVHLAVLELIREKKLMAKRKYFFCYKVNKSKKIFNDDRHASHYLNLTDPIWRQKKDIIHEIYGYSKMSFEYRSCLKKETYKKF
ncbi:hypothetical protein COU23_00125 [Candidatus Kuenenbacteria bacterium CG10_big_fil_rev_8_21_14_0_10_36_11]|uniref:PIG-L family deacetylase n=1 Tax=Candidatus Kuenenbacteria bacterium CG10_big_fil_rev_8_21_14_0_10_36_11 TaxID=1974618 RepID=A0A2M6WBJ0_9BACT|nr:MAG: hypothetical protein COU23_00125 [Candidatus Kuenenbacteria bacterium CG10_big_fil_rev_8_21_14_0_10_36_11]